MIPRGFGGHVVEERFDGRPGVRPRRHERVGVRPPARALAPDVGRTTRATTPRSREISSRERWSSSARVTTRPSATWSTACASSTSPPTRPHRPGGAQPEPARRSRSSGGSTALIVSARLRRPHALGLSRATPDTTRRAASRDRRPRRRAHVRRRAVLVDASHRRPPRAPRRARDVLRDRGGGRDRRAAAPSSGVSSTEATRSATTRGRTPTSRPSTSRRFTRRCAGRPRRSPEVGVGNPALWRAPFFRCDDRVRGRGREPGGLRGVVLVDARRLGAPGRGDCRGASSPTSHPATSSSSTTAARRTSLPSFRGRRGTRPSTPSG